MKIKNTRMLWHLLGYFIYILCVAFNVRNVVLCLQKGGLEGWMIFNMFNTAYWVAVIAKLTERWNSWER